MAYKRWFDNLSKLNVSAWFRVTAHDLIANGCKVLDSKLAMLFTLLTLHICQHYLRLHAVCVVILRQYRYAGYKVSRKFWHDEDLATGSEKNHLEIKNKISHFDLSFLKRYIYVVHFMIRLTGLIKCRTFNMATCSSASISSQCRAKAEACYV